MEELFLVRPTPGDEAAVLAMVAAWRAFGGRMNPGLLRRLTGDYTGWLNRLRQWETGADIGGAVPQTFYLLKRADGAVVGAAALRHFLNDSNRVSGGHVAYGVAPAFRGYGYGNRVLALALEKLWPLGVSRALVTCDADNAGSRAVILHNGGVLENRTTDEDGILIERYWIEPKTE